MRVHRPSLNVTDGIERIIADLCARLPDFAHIDPARLLVCVSRARNRSREGTFAKIVPMRFPNGTPFHTVKGQCYALPQIPAPQGEILYLIYLYVPRFFEQPFERRVLTLVHELYHIAPAFDGTIRKFGGRAHGASREQFNARLQPLVQAYLTEQVAANGLHTLLREDYRTLTQHSTLVGRTLAIPKAVKVG